MVDRTQKEIIANLQEKNVLLANLKDVVERISDCEKEKAELENQIRLKTAEKEATLSSTEHQHAKIKIDAYINELDFEVKELRRKKKIYEKQLIEKEQKLDLVETVL